MDPTLDYYRLLPYTRRSELMEGREGSFYWTVWIEEIPECRAYGDTEADAMVEFNTAFDDYIEAMIDAGLEITRPDRDIPHSTAMVVRGQEEFRAVFSGPVPDSNPGVEAYFKGKPDPVETEESYMKVAGDAVPA